MAAREMRVGEPSLWVKPFSGGLDAWDFMALLTELGFLAGHVVIDMPPRTGLRKQRFSHAIEGRRVLETTRG